jgi:hypothetical protein
LKARSANEIRRRLARGARESENGAMTRIERYIFRTAALAFLAGLFALTAVVWITQALRQFDRHHRAGRPVRRRALLPQQAQWR